MRVQAPKSSAGIESQGFVHYSQSHLHHLVLHLQKQHRHIHFVPHFVRRSAVQNVADETVAVCRHRDQIDILFSRQFDDFVRWLAQSKDGIAGKTFIDQLSRCAFPDKRGPVSSLRFRPACS